MARKPLAISETAGRILARRPDLAAKMRGGALLPPTVATAVVNPGAMTPLSLVGSGDEARAVLESIVELTDRPTVFVTHDDFDLPAEQAIAQRLEKARQTIAPRLRSVGLVEVFDGAVKWPVGTAWMVADGIALTNRHVAEKFAMLNDDGNPVFLTDFRDRPYRATVDFAEEHGSSQEKEVAVIEIVYLAKAGDKSPDLCLLRLDPAAQIPRPIPLLAEDAPEKNWVAVVGYPQPDDRVPAEGREVEENYFGGIYGVKRLSPGQIDPAGADVPEWALAHDATTLGGNSGSVLIDFETGCAAGAHFKGIYRKANYAVRASAITALLQSLEIDAISISPTAVPADVDEGEEAADAAGSPDGFDGYVEDFIGKAGDFLIPLPIITEDAPGHPVPRLDDGGTVLTYRNFSVEMCAERRLCYYSAVNIDGANTFSIKGARPGWKFDDRIHRGYQIKAECYGKETDGKFSRGHMTRREDPNWGDDRDDAVISNAHTFFVTNACPQIQPFNAGVWLSLEDYALENADQDDMRISVFTGPIFHDSGPSKDPTYFGVMVPVEFWKIIAFKHDATKKLSATGYRMSQRNLLPTGEEFVFGQFANSQVPISFIEKQTGLYFHHLREHDPLETGEESAGATFNRLLTPRDAVFV